MKYMILDGKSLASEIYKSLKDTITTLDKKPTLWAVLVWESQASLRYIKQKRKYAKQVWMHFELFQFPQDISQKNLEQELDSLNRNEDISWYIVQLPLPGHIDTLQVIKTIDPKRDVDGFHPENQWKIMIDDKSWFAPCTPAGVMVLLEHYNIPISGKHVVILGRSNIVGKPIAQMCISEWATVTSCNSRTPDISRYTQNADIVICATGQKHILKAHMISDTCSVIDVGFSVVDGKIYGDAQTKEIMDNWNSITPVPGGVWPMTVAMLLSNTLKAHSMKHD